MKTVGCAGDTDTLVPEPPMTLFERKYHERGQALWRWRGQATDVAIADRLS